MKRPLMGRALDFVCNNEWVVWFAVFCSIAIIIRVGYWSTALHDFVLFLDPWIDTLRTDGLQALGTDFSNYNSPYLFLLWLFSLVIPDNLSVVKTIALVFDLLLAGAIYLLLKQLGRKTSTSLIVAVAILSAPTIAVNSAFFGQCDNILGLCAVLAFYFFLKAKSSSSWATVGAGIATKMQGIFVAPALLSLHIQRRSFSYRYVLVCIGAFLGLSIIPHLFGGDIRQILAISIDALQPMFGQKLLTFWTPNIYQFLPNDLYDILKIIGIIVTAIVLLVVFYFSYKTSRQKNTHPQTIQQVTLYTAILLLLPFLLPTMHERYYYQAEIFLCIVAVLNPKFIWAALSLQIITMSAHINFDLGGPSINPILQLGAICVGVIIVSLLLFSFRPQTKPHTQS